MRPGADGKNVETEIVPHFLDLGEVEHAINILKPEVDHEYLTDMLMLMQATRFRERIVVVLDPSLVELGKERPDWNAEERARLGLLE